MYNLLIQILGGEQIDINYALALFNIARYDFESRRLWKVLVANSAVANPMTALAGKNPLVSYPLPSPATPSVSTPYFMQPLLEGGMVLQNTTNNNQTMNLKEVAQEYHINNTNSNAFWVDYVARVFYILGNLSFAASINLFYIADFGDITLLTGWNGFRPRDSNALVFQAAARYRLGTDYDDVAARNADNNYKTAEDMYNSMTRWDANLQLNSYQHRNFSATFGGSSGSSFPPPNNGQGYGEWGLADWTG
jgi:hypothetical protein